MTNLIKIYRHPELRESYEVLQVDDTPDSMIALRALCGTSRITVGLTAEGVAVSLAGPLGVPYQVPLWSWVVKNSRGYYWTRRTPPYYTQGWEQVFLD